VGESKAEGFIYEDNQMKGFSRRGAHAAWDINNWGVIVGELNNQHAFIFDQKTMIDLGTLDGGQKSASYATAINDSGKVVGYSTSNDGGSTHAFLYENGVMHDLGTLHGGYSVAMGINNLGAIVGHSDGAAFIYENGHMKDLNDLMMPTGSFAYLSVAQDINDAGQVVGRVFTPEGQRGFIVTPAD
jgi:probable HAF family extracellular repeat protein